MAEPTQTAALKGKKKRAKTDRSDAQHLRELLAEGRVPESWVPPAHVLEVRTLGRLYIDMVEQRRQWQQRIKAQLFHQGVPAGVSVLGVAAAGSGWRDWSCRRRAAGRWARRWSS